MPLIRAADKTQYTSKFHIILAVFNQFTQNRWLQNTHLISAILEPQIFVNSPQGSPQSGIEMILDRIVSPMLL